MKAVDDNNKGGQSLQIAQRPTNAKGKKKKSPVTGHSLLLDATFGRNDKQKKSKEITAK